MGKKKNKIAKISEEQYFAYIAGLKNADALFCPDGEMLIPSELKASDDSDDGEN